MLASTAAILGCAHILNTMKSKDRYLCKGVLLNNSPPQNDTLRAGRLGTRRRHAMALSTDSVLGWVGGALGVFSLEEKVKGREKHVHNRGVHPASYLNDGACEDIILQCLAVVPNNRPKYGTY